MSNTTRRTFLLPPRCVWYIGITVLLILFSFIISDCMLGCESVVVHSTTQQEQQHEVPPRKKKKRWNNPYLNFIPKPTKPFGPPVVPGIRQHKVENLPPQCVPKNNQQEEAKIWNTCDPDPAKSCALDKVNASIKLQYPTRIATHNGMSTIHFIQNLLRLAWGNNYPRIDLYVRAGCGGADELKYLFETVELFWPVFLGDVLVVLDHDDDIVLQHLIPLHRSQHSFHVVYEHCPCMKSRWFNQYSYLTLDRYTKAEYAVTIDSDCALHSPVTPDMLFNSRKQLIMPTAIAGFEAYSFNEDQQAFTLRDFAPIGHAMCSQPVSIVVDSLPAYRKWIQHIHGGNDCYEVVMQRHMDTHDFCWMCQLNVFLFAVNYSGVDLHFVDTRTDPYFRYGSHVTYELWNWHYWINDGTDGGIIQYDAAVNDLIRGGLCRWFGREMFGPCDDAHMQYHRHVTRTYADGYIMNRMLNVSEVDDYFDLVLKKRMWELVDIVLGGGDDDD